MFRSDLLQGWKGVRFSFTDLMKNNEPQNMKINNYSVIHVLLRKY